MSPEATSCARRQSNERGECTEKYDGGWVTRDFIQALSCASQDKGLTRATTHVYLEPPCYRLYHTVREREREVVESSFSFTKSQFLSTPKVFKRYIYLHIYQTRRVKIERERERTNWTSTPVSSLTETRCHHLTRTRTRCHVTSCHQTPTLYYHRPCFVYRDGRGPPSNVCAHDGRVVGRESYTGMVGEKVIDRKEYGQCDAKLFLTLGHLYFQ